MGQNDKNLEYLNHFLRNNIVNIQGCFKQIENYLNLMNDAWMKYQETLPGADNEPE